MAWPDAGSRPRSITVIGWIFIAIGAVGIVRDGLALRASPLGELGPALASGLLALVGGAGLLRGAGWARWLLVAWMGFHIVLSALHSAERLVVHIVLFAPILYFLFRPLPAVH
jgi:hypothetical protein